MVMTMVLDGGFRVSEFRVINAVWLYSQKAIKIIIRIGNIALDAAVQVLLLLSISYLIFIVAY